MFQTTNQFETIIQNHLSCVLNVFFGKGPYKDPNTKLTHTEV